MALLDKKQADGLLVAKLDRLSRSVADFGTILDRAKAKGWSVPRGSTVMVTCGRLSPVRSRSRES